MRHKTLDVQPFEATYRVFNKVTREYHGEFNRLIEAINYAKGSFKPANYNQARISFTLKRDEAVDMAAHLKSEPDSKTE
jgi:hypothetical protein